MFYKPVFQNGEYSYILSEPTEHELENSSLVVQGFVVLEREYSSFCKMKWKATLDQNSIVDIILAGAADHRQYPDENYILTISDREYENYKAIALKEGFSIDNPTTFFINHVYPLQVGKIFTPEIENIQLLVNL